MTLLTHSSYDNSPPTGARYLFGYELLEKLGDGAGSVIHAVSDPKTSQIYALKHVYRKTDKDVRFIDQLHAEHQVSQHVAHPNLRKSVDFQQKKTLLGKVTEAVLILELFDGQPLDTLDIRDVPRLTQIFLEAARGLEAIHTAGFVHCDFKPNNLLLGREGMVKVIDLGQACTIGTKKERIQGTPDYIAPEQVKLLPVTPRTDIYNFGATMYWALTGTKMPTLFTIKKGSNSLLSDDLIAAPAQLNPKVPATLSNFVMECVRLNPTKRPESMGEVVRRLEIILHGMTHRPKSQ